MAQQRKRQARVTKLKRGEKLLIEITLPRTGIVTVRVPVGGTIRLEKSIAGLHVGGDLQ